MEHIKALLKQFDNCYNTLYYGTLYEHLLQLVVKGNQGGVNVKFPVVFVSNWCVCLAFYHGNQSSDPRLVLELQCIVKIKWDASEGLTTI